MYRRIVYNKCLLKIICIVIIVTIYNIIPLLTRNLLLPEHILQTKIADNHKDIRQSQKKYLREIP